LGAARGEMEMGSPRSVTRRTNKRRSAAAAWTEEERKGPRPGSGRLGSIAATHAPRRRREHRALNRRGKSGEIVSRLLRGFDLHS
jgi:hypothetical protein